MACPNRGSCIHPNTTHSGEGPCWGMDGYCTGRAWPSTTILALHTASPYHREISVLGILTIVIHFAKAKLTMATGHQVCAARGLLWNQPAKTSLAVTAEGPLESLTSKAAIKRAGRLKSDAQERNSSTACSGSSHGSYQHNSMLPVRCQANLWAEAIPIRRQRLVFGLPLSAESLLETFSCLFVSLSFLFLFETGKLDMGTINQESNKPNVSQGGRRKQKRGRQDIVAHLLRDKW